MLRKFSFTVALCAVLFAGSASGADLPIKITPHVPDIHFFFIKTAAPRATGAGAVGTGAAGALAFGFLGVVAALCAYDIYLKIEGVKNWDGTPKAGPPQGHRGHH